MAKSNIPAWPKSAQTMRDLGWKSKGKDTCKSCGVEIWWAINPNDNWQPMVETHAPPWIPHPPIDARYFQPHHIDCPHAGKHKKSRETAKCGS